MDANLYNFAAFNTQVSSLLHCIKEEKKETRKMAAGHLLVFISQWNITPSKQNNKDNNSKINIANDLETRRAKNFLWYHKF